MDNLFSGLALVIVVATLVAFFMRLIKQPLIIGHIITGIVVGPAAFHLIKSPDTFSTFSEIGITLLLFIIGLGLNLNVVKEVGRVAALTGISQVGLTIAAGWILMRAIGIGSNEALFLAVAFSISSTIIILKILSDKKELSRLYGKITIGVSLVQDLVATIALIIVATATGGGGGFSLNLIIVLALKGLALALAMYLVSTKIIPSLQKFVAGSQEFLFLFALAWGFGCATLFQKVGFSIEIGALFAGICLAPLQYAQEIASRLRPLRDFFVIVFFISLGTGLSFSSISDNWLAVVIGLIVVILIKPLIVLSTMGAMSYTKRTSFNVGASLTQVGEFSIIFIVLGIRQGFIDKDIQTIITSIALVSIAVSAYLMIYNDKIYGALEKYLSIFERKKVHQAKDITRSNELVLFGYQRGGHEFLKAFESLKKRYVVIDYDPEIIDLLVHKGINHIYGDATDHELLEEAGLDNAKLVVSTMSNHDTTVSLLRFLETRNPDAVIICQADTAERASELYKMGASYVILPHYIGSEKLSAFIRRVGIKKSEFKKFREKHLAYLEVQFGVMENDGNSEKFGHTILKSLNLGNRDEQQ